MKADCYPQKVPNTVGGKIKNLIEAHILQHLPQQRFTFYGLCIVYKIYFSNTVRFQKHSLMWWLRLPIRNKEEGEPRWPHLKENLNLMTDKDLVKEIMESVVNTNNAI